MDPYRRQNIFTISAGAFPLSTENNIKPVYVQEINKGGYKKEIDIFYSNRDDEPEKAVLFGNHIFYHYGKISETPLTEKSKEFLTDFFVREQNYARQRLQTMMKRLGGFTVNDAATKFKSFYTAAPEEAVEDSVAELKKAKTPGTAAQTADLYYGKHFYEATKDAANKYAYHHGIFGTAKKVMMTEFMLADENKLLTEHGKNKAKANAILRYYRLQVSTTFNPIIQKIRRKFPLAMATPYESLAAEMYGALSAIKSGADGYPALSELGEVYDGKTSSVHRGRAAATSILHMLGNYLSHESLYHTLPIDEKNKHIKAVIGQFALHDGGRFPEFDKAKLKEAVVLSGLFGSVAHNHNGAAALTENLSRGHQHGMYLMGKTKGEFSRNEGLAVGINNIFTNSNKFRVSMNSVAADEDFSTAIRGMLQSLKTAGKTQARKLLQGGLTAPRKKTANNNQIYWAVPYLGIYDVELSEFGEGV